MLALEELFIAYGHNAIPGSDLADEVSAEVSLALEALSKRESLVANARNAFDLGQLYVSLVGTAAAASADFEERLHAEPQWDPLSMIMDVRDVVRNAASVSIKAIDFECRVVWQVMARGSYRAGDVDRAIRDVERHAGHQE